jgi:hypothetical protein
MYNDNDDNLYLSEEEFVNSIKAKWRIVSKELREKLREENRIFGISNSLDYASK